MRKRGDSATVRGLPERLDELHSAMGVPVTARRPWLQAWVQAHADYRPLVVAVDGVGGRLDAVAPLAVKEGPVRRVVAVGHGLSDALVFPARTPRAAEQLADAIFEALGSAGRPWTLVLRHFLPDDLVVPELAERLRHCRTVSGDVMPILRFGAERTLDAHVSTHHRRKMRGLRNRIGRMDLHPELAHLTRVAEVEAVLPEVEALMRARDAAVGRPCLLDDSVQRTFFRTVVLDHAERQEIQLTVLRLRGRLAAYALCFRDQDMHRMWNCRFDPAWSDLSLGKVSVDDAITHALDTGAAGFDFMRGDESYKQSYANETIRLQDLYAWSGAVLAARGNLFLAARDQAKRIETNGGPGARLVSAARRSASRVKTR